MLVPRAPQRYAPPAALAPRRFPKGTAAFELPCVGDAIKLFKQLLPTWAGWVEDGPHGSFAVVTTPERVAELNGLLAEVENWMSKHAFVAIRFHLDGRAYNMQRGGVIREG